MAGLAYGLLLDLWFWPYLSAGTQRRAVAGRPAGARTCTGSWPSTWPRPWGGTCVRAVTNAVLVLVAGAPVLAALRRVSRRAAFGAPVAFEPVTGPTP